MFRNPFGRKKPEPEALFFRLKYEPVPENAVRFADDMVAAAKRIDGTDLDYTPESLDRVDTIVEGFRTDGTTVEQIRETLFGFGRYVGEVFVRHAGGTWQLTGNTPLAAVESLPLVVDLPNGQVINPLGKVFKRMQLGPGENLRFFYRAFTTPT